MDGRFHCAYAIVAKNLYIKKGIEELGLRITDKGIDLKIFHSIL